MSHVTFLPAGDEVWATFTDTGKIVGLVANIAGLLVLRAGSKESLNVNGAYLDILRVLLGSIAVIVAAAIIAAPVGSAPTRSPGR